LNLLWPDQDGPFNPGALPGQGHDAYLTRLAMHARLQSVGGDSASGGRSAKCRTKSSAESENTGDEANQRPMPLDAVM
jgi:hypothetical protein